jgi:cytochrome oxidase Cu insertion factor (SCO1/SenC/PrrC family)
MSKAQRNLTILLWLLLGVAIYSMYASGLWRPRRPAEPQPIAQPRPEVPAFSLIDQNGNPFTNETLKGKPYVACFIFSRCVGPCPAMMQRMARIQDATRNADIHLVSFTVDPQNDSPEVLKAYGQKFGADADKWTLATGKPDDIYDLARRMMIAVQPAQDNNPIEHGTWLLLIAPDGKMHGHYSGQDDDGWRKLSEDALSLAGRRQ